jgi:hypothetical protein
MLFNVAKASDSNEEKTCIASYLKSMDMLESGFDVSNYSTECDGIVDKRKMDFEKDIMVRLTAEDDQRCILRLFNDYKINLLYLKGLTYFNYNKTLASNYYVETSETTGDILNAVKSVCGADEKYGIEFDHSFVSRDEAKRNAKNAHFQECLKKYFFENKILDASEFHVNVDELNESNCEEIVEEIESSVNIDVDDSALFYGLSSMKSQTCVNGRIRDEKVLQKITSFGVTVLLDLNETQINSLRIKYIDVMSKNVKILLECLSTLLNIN